MAYKSKPFRKKYGFMGTSSSLNGLTNWIDKHIELEGDPFNKSHAPRRWELAIDIIIAYGCQHIPSFIPGRDPQESAERVAKWIDSRGTPKVSGFLVFTQWVFKHYQKHRP